MNKIIKIKGDEETIQRQLDGFTLTDIEYEELEEDQVIEVRKALEKFIKDRPEKFPNVSEDQITKWVKSVTDYIQGLVWDESETFYDCKPEDVEEV